MVNHSSWRSLCSLCNHKTLSFFLLDWQNHRNSKSSGDKTFAPAPLATHCLQLRAEIFELIPFPTLPSSSPGPTTPGMRVEFGCCGPPLRRCFLPADPGGRPSPGRDPVRGGAGVQGREPSAAGHGLLHRPQVPVRDGRAPGECPLHSLGNGQPCSAGGRSWEHQEELGVFCP